MPVPERPSWPTNFIPTPDDGSVKADKHSYLESNIGDIEQLLSEEISRDLMMDCFSEPLFFFRFRCLFLKDKVSDVMKEISKYTKSPSTPKRKDIECLRDQEPLSLFLILRLHHFFSLTRHMPTTSIVRTIAEQHSLQDGLPSGSVVPSIRCVSAQLIDNALAARQISVGEVAERIAAENRDINLVGKLSTAIEYLRRPDKYGQKNKDFCITTKTANILYNGLKEIPIIQHNISGEYYDEPPFDVIFPLNPIMKSKSLTEKELSGISHL